MRPTDETPVCGPPHDEYPEGVQLESVLCPLGCEAGDDFVLEGWDRLHKTPGRFALVRCRACGLLRTNPRPDANSMGAYYPADYGPYRGTRVRTAAGVVGRYRAVAWWKRFVRRVFAFNTNRLPTLAPGRMLEIGCASGSFLHHMAGLGWDVEGIEFSPAAAAAARTLGYPVWAGRLEEAADPSKPFDLIVGWMVLEHLHDPLLALCRLHAWAGPDARLVLSVPDAGCVGLRLFGAAWRALHLPNHLFHYTPRTLALLLDRAGWRIEKVMGQRVLNNWVVSLGNRWEDEGRYARARVRLQRYAEEGGWLHYLFFPLAILLAAVGQTGDMTVWARRKE